MAVHCNWIDLCSSPADPLKRHKEPMASPPCRREQSIRKEKQHFSQERQCNFGQAQNWGMVRLWSPTCLWCWRIPLLTLHLWSARLGQRFLPTTIEHHEFASLSALSDSKIFWFEIVCVWRPHLHQRIIQSDRGHNGRLHEVPFLVASPANHHLA